MLLALVVYFVQQKLYSSVLVHNAHTINVTRFLQRDLLLQMEKQ